jgi:cell division septation protein DedD
MIAGAAVAAAPGGANQAAANSAASGHRAQVALVRSKADADALVQKLRGPLASAIGNREPSVDQVSLGGMGAFHRIRIGPFASQAEAHSTCERVKAGGLNDCVAVVQ